MYCCLIAVVLLLLSQTLEDARFELIMSKVNLVIHEDTTYQKGTLPMRTQKCFAVKVSTLSFCTAFSEMSNSILFYFHVCFITVHDHPDLE